MDNYNLGLVFTQKDVRDYEAVCCVSNEEFPEEFELELSKVKDQGKISSCVAHSLSTIIEYFNKKQIYMTEEMSVGYIYGNRSKSSHKDKGMIIRDTLATIKEYGDVKKKDFSYNIEVPKAIEKYEEVADKLFEVGSMYRISAYCKITGEDHMKHVLMSNGPILIGMDWYTDMKVKDGILTSSLDKNKKSGGHAMVIYGWDSRGWKVQNSWGESWGDKGRAIIPYDMKIREAWTIVDDIIEGMEIIKPFSSDIGKVIAKVLNFIFKIIFKLRKA